MDNSKEARKIDYGRFHEVRQQAKAAKSLIVTVKIRALNGNRMIGKVGQIEVPSSCQLRRGDLIRFRGHETTYRVVSV